MEIRIVEGSVLAHAEQLMPLLADHVQELATRKDLMVLAPDWAKYRNLEEAGLLLMLYVWADEELIGYSCNFVGQHLHYSGLRYCHNDVLYLAPAWRESEVGLALIRETEARAKARGALLVSWHAKPGTALDKLLPRLGYDVQDVIHMKEL